MRKTTSEELEKLDAVFEADDAGRQLNARSPEQYAAARKYWSTLLGCRHLSPRMRELVLLAVHASASTLNGPAIGWYVDRALKAGASREDVLDTLLAIVGLANHSVTIALPILLKVLKEQESETAGHIPEIRPEIAAVKDEYYRTRRVGRYDSIELIASVLPEYGAALWDLSTQTWTHGSLTRKERHLLCIGIDSSVAHAYEPGIEAHMRLAFENGATREEILEVIQLTALMGIEGFVMGADALVEASATRT